MLYMEMYELEERLKKNVSNFEIVYPDPWCKGVHHVFHVIPVIPNSEDVIYMLLRYNRNQKNKSTERITCIGEIVLCDLDMLMKYIQEHIKDIKEYRYEIKITSAGVTDQFQLKDPMEPFYAFVDYLKKFKREHYPHFHIEIHKKENDHCITEKMKFYFIDGPDQIYISVKFIEGQDTCGYSTRYYKNIPEMLRSIDPYLREEMQKQETSRIDMFCDHVDSGNKCVLFPIYYRSYERSKLK